MAERRSTRRRNGTPADRFDLYQRSVQHPAGDIEIIEQVFRELSGREPLRLREDFCGTAYLSTSWAAGRPDRTALAIDWDLEPLAWGRKHNLLPAGKPVAARVHLLCANVLEVAPHGVDVACAFNFSHCALKSRAQLRRYFRAVRDSLAPGGLFFLELYGGTEAVIATEERRELDGFTYVWQQAMYNPVSHETLCHIHFELSDGTRVRHAFTYDWRLWTIPETREVLEEAGFRDSRVYWERVDRSGAGTGEYVVTEIEENQEGWLVYVVAIT